MHALTYGAFFLTCAVVAGCSTSADTATRSPVAFEIGAREFTLGDEVVIEELLSTGPDISRGDFVTVRGSYRLESRRSGCSGPAKDRGADPQVVCG